MKQNLTEGQGAPPEDLHRWLTSQVDILGYTASPGGTRSVWYVSPRFARVLGLDERALQEQSFEQIVHPADVETAAAALRNATATGASAEYRLMTRSGRVVFVRDETFLVPGDDGRPAIRGSIRDITDDRVTAGALFESRTRMQLLAEQLPAIVWTTDEAASLTSISGKGVADLQLEPRDFPGLEGLNAHRRALRGERVDFDVEWGGRSFQAHVEPLDDGLGPLGAIGVAVDVTERKQEAERLRRAEEQLEVRRKMEALGRLAGGVAHDFNNLLASILGNAQLLLESLEPGDPRREDAERIRAVSENGALLVSRLFAFARQQPLAPQVVDVNAVVSRIRKLLTELMSNRGQLSISLAFEPMWVRIDVSALEQVLLNLVVNARDALPDGGTVVVETRAADDPNLGPVVLIVVTDPGIGMDSATQARIFEPFFTTKPPGAGTGLGLATVHGIVEQSGGAISVESAPGRGTTICVTLPADATPTTGARQVPPEVQAGADQIVLVVDDDDEVRTFARRALERCGYRVIEAATGEAAVDAWQDRSGEVDVVLADIVLPGLDGLSVADRLLALGYDGGLLFMTGSVVDDDLASRVKGLGARVLSKPFTPETLASEIAASRTPAQVS